MDLGIRGRAALVGGASVGLGAAVAEALAAEGCRLLLWSRGGEKLDARARALRETHRVEVATVAGDAAEGGTAERVIAAARDFGTIDIAVLNSGGPPTVDPLATAPDDWHRAFKLLAVTPISVASALLPAMRAQRWGRVVALLSWSVKEPIDNLAYSNACRAALVGWLKTVAPVVIADGVTVNGILTGPMATPRVDWLDEDRATREGRSFDEVRAARIASIPAGRLGDPAELAASVAHLCGSGAGFQTGTFTLIDGGLVRAL